jgi:pimeloyl-ACP methyl ester carboxylesterase
VSVLSEFREEDALAEMEGQYQRFMRLMPDNEAAARGFVQFWSGPGAWEKIGERGRSAISELAPKVRLEMMAARSDKTSLATIVSAPPPTTIVLGERTRIAPKAVARRIAEAFKATVIVVPDAGHMLPLTHPAAIVDFLRQVQPSIEVNNEAAKRRWESHG